MKKNIFQGNYRISKRYSKKIPELGYIHVLFKFALTLLYGNNQIENDEKL
jgi:hypothetical protein